MTLTPSTLQRPPRRVRGFISGDGQAWFARIFIMPHTLVGIGATVYWLFLLLWAMFGTDLKAVVTGTDTSYSPKRGTTYRVKYQYAVGGQMKSGSGSVSRAEYDRFKAHDDPSPEVTVRYFSLGPLDHSELRSGKKRLGSAGFFTIWVAFWDSIVGLFFYMLWIKPLMARRLYKYGEATPGTLIGKRIQRGKSTSYYVSYKFNDPVTGNEFTAETQVWRTEDWNNAREGQPVIVLYAPENPKRNTVYEFGGYQVELEDAMGRF